MRRGFNMLRNAASGGKMRTKFRIALLAATVGVALAMTVQSETAVAYVAQTGSDSQITGKIDERNLLVLQGNTRPEASVAGNDRGAVPDSTQFHNIELLLRRSHVKEKAFKKEIVELHTPSSAQYHQWLTAKRIGNKYGISDADISVVGSWLSGHGFTVNGVSPDHMILSFDGTAGNVREAFHTDIHYLDVGGVRHIANMRDPAIPAALASAVAGIVQLHDFYGHPESIVKARKPLPGKKIQGTTGSGSGTFFYLMPEDLAKIYNFTPLFNSGISGKGQTVAVVEDSDVFKMGDWALFRTIAGLAGYKDATFTQVHPSAAGLTCTDPGVTGDEDEATIDVDWSTAAAPDANIVLASCKSVRVGTVSTTGVLVALQGLIQEPNGPKIISMSYGECEAQGGATLNASFDAAMQSAVAQGITVFVSSGDANAAACDRNALNATHGIAISGWMSSVYDMSIGGTDFGTEYQNCQSAANSGGGSYPGCMSGYWNTTNDKAYGSAKSYMPEIPWNGSCASELLSEFIAGTVAYGPTGFCNTAQGQNGNFSTFGGSGGPSACATGSASTRNTVSGTCAGWAKPSYQGGTNAVGPTVGSFAGEVADNVRDTPDVSLFASNGIWGSYYAICDSNPAVGSLFSLPTACQTANPANWGGFGGTSVSSPIMAGVQALINQKTGQSWGLANTMYYQLAAAEYGASGKASCSSTLGNGVGSNCVFYDLTQGDIDSSCKLAGTVNNNCYFDGATVGVQSTSTSAYQPAYNTTTGWDFASGIGSVNVTNLVNAWNASTSASRPITVARKGS